MGLQSQAGYWHIQRFPDAQMEHVVIKTVEELGEVSSAVLALAGKNSATSRGGNIVEESADVVICLMVLLQRWVPNADLLLEVQRKLDILCDPNSGHRAALRRSNAD